MKRRRGWSPEKRRFEPDVPVHAWTRFSYQFDLMAHPALRRLALAIILQAAAKAHVTILGLAILGNHVHVLVVQGVVRKGKRTREGIYPFMRNWKRELSRRLNILKVKGCKYQGPYQSTNLHTSSQLLGACAYVLDQAVRHGLGWRDVWVSDGVLGAEADGVMAAVPDLGLDAGADQEARVAWYGELIERTMEEAVRLIALDELAVEVGEAPAAEGPRMVSAERRARRQALEARRRARRAVLDRVDRHGLSTAYWYAAGEAVLAAVPGLSPSAEVAGMRMLRLAEVQDGWGELSKRLQGYVLPPLEVTERRRESDRRVLETVVSGGGATARVVWARRVPETEPPP